MSRAKYCTTALLVFLPTLAPASNRTFNQVADSATYFSESKPCALEITKDSGLGTMTVKYTQNPVYWFAGDDAFRDYFGQWHGADRCERRDQYAYYYCSPALDFCQETGEDHTPDLGGHNRVLKVQDNGELVEADLSASMDFSIRGRFHVYTQEESERINCAVATRAKEAAEVIRSFVEKTLQTPECEVSFNDQGHLFEFYSARCIRRYLGGIYIENTENRIFEEDEIAMATKTWEGKDRSCLRDLDGREVAYKECARAGLDQARDILTHLAKGYTCSAP